MAPASCSQRRVVPRHPMPTAQAAPSKLASGSSCLTSCQHVHPSEHGALLNALTATTTGALGPSSWETMQSPHVSSARSEFYNSGQWGLPPVTLHSGVSTDCLGLGHGGHELGRWQSFLGRLLRTPSEASGKREGRTTHVLLFWGNFKRLLK